MERRRGGRESAAEGRRAVDIRERICIVTTQPTWLSPRRWPLAGELQNAGTVLKLWYDRCRARAECRSGSDNRPLAGPVVPWREVGYCPVLPSAAESQPLSIRRLDACFYAPFRTGCKERCLLCRNQLSETMIGCTESLAVLDLTSTELNWDARSQFLACCGMSDWFLRLPDNSDDHSMSHSTYILGSFDVSAREAAPTADHMPQLDHGY